MTSVHNIVLDLQGRDETVLRRARFPSIGNVMVCLVQLERLPRALKRAELNRPSLHFLVAPTDLRSGQERLLARSMSGQVNVAVP